MQSNFQDNSIYFVEIDKVSPNPFQPRREFDPAQLDSLSDSIRMYGVLQPLVVTRKEVFSEDGGMSTVYELIAGERRLRASKLAGLREVPVIIRSDEQSDREKLEVAIIENLQREDLNPVDRAVAFRQLVDEFKLKHAEVAKKVGKSREYVSNTMRILALPEEMLQAITDKKMTEGHARTLLMLTDRPEEQMVLFKEILLKKLTVRAAEKIARRVAYDKVRKKERIIDPHTVEVEDEMSESLGTRVHIERKAVGGKIEIDFFSDEDLEHILKVLKEKHLDENPKDVNEKMNNFVNQSGGLAAATSLVFEKENAGNPEPTTVTEEIEKIKPFSYSSQSDIVEEEKEIEADDVNKTPSGHIRLSDSDDNLKEEETEESINDNSKVEETSQYSYETSKEVSNEEDETVSEKPNKQISISEKSSKEGESILENTEGENNENSQYSYDVSKEEKNSEESINNLSKIEETNDNTEQAVESVSISDDFAPKTDSVENENLEKKEDEPISQEQPRSRYLEKIEPSDMGNINIGSDFMGSSNKEDAVDANHIVKEREEVGLNRPNVITDFVETKKETESEPEIDTPKYGNDDDLYSVKGM
jgi:ParB family chromosome partitioning protein